MKEFIVKVNDFRESIKVNKNGVCKNRKKEILFKYRQLNDIYKEVRSKIKDFPGLFIKIEDELLREPTTIRSTVTLSDGQNHIFGVGYAVLGELKNKYGEDSMGMPQQTGCAQTYARKYAFEALLLLDDDVDADSLSGESSSVQKAVQNTPSSPPPTPKPPTETFKIEKTAEMPNQILPCPKCQKGKIVDSRTAIACDRQKDGCEFVALKRGSNMNVDDIKTMLNGKETRVLKMQKKGGGTYYGSYSLSDDMVPEFRFRTEACFELGGR